MSAAALDHLGTVVSIIAFAVCVAVLAVHSAVRELGGAGRRTGAPASTPRAGGALRVVVVLALCAGAVGMASTLVRLLAAVYAA